MYYRVLLVSLAVLVSGTGLAEDGERSGSFLKPDVDNPPEEVYEPLHGVGHQQGISSRVNGSDEIEESRKLRQEAAERRRQRYASPEYRKHVQQITRDVPIADGTSPPKTPEQREAATVYRRPDGSLYIGDPLDQ